MRSRKAKSKRPFYLPLSMRTFCTIITSSHIPYALVLYRSYARFLDVPLHVLCVDREHADLLRLPLPHQVHLLMADTLPLDETGNAIAQKYRDDPDALRWSLKPVLLRHLLTDRGYDQAIFLDTDICFFADPAFLFDALTGGAMLLSPHWRCSDPESDAFNFALNFRDGIYNGGFIGAARDGIPALEWLAKACLFKCTNDYHEGFFADQKYLDFLASRYEGIRVLRHKGCNVANWNRVDCKRTASGDTVLINAEYPVVFIHFTKSTIYGILYGTDHMLDSFLKEYEQLLLEVSPDFKPFALPAKRKRTMREKILARLKKG